MIAKLINDFRQQNGRPPIHNWNTVDNDHCQAHCLAMVNHNFLYHAEEYYRPGKAEAVGVAWWDYNLEMSVARIIWGYFANSPGRKNILLMNNLAYGVVVHNWQVYLTIRGW